MKILQSVENLNLMLQVFRTFSMSYPQSATLPKTLDICPLITTTFHHEKLVINQKRWGKLYCISVISYQHESFPNILIDQQLTQSKEVLQMMTMCEFATFCDCSTEILKTFRELNLLTPFSYDSTKSEGMYYPFQRLVFEIINCLLANDFTAADILRFRKGINDNKQMIKKIIEDELVKRTKTHSLTPDFLKTADMILHTDYEIPVKELICLLNNEKV